MFTEAAGDPVDSDSLCEKFADWIKEREKPYCNGEALWWERLALGASELDRKKAIQRVTTRGEEAFRKSAPEADMTALCLSGGGIRSAAFSLGVVQALAAKELLTSFSYLSTVSGGGYLGGFLQRWILGKPKDGRNEIGVQQALAQSVAGGTSPQIDALREGTNFVTPRVGVFSNDSWVAIATSLRNIFVNWLLFGPMFILLGAAPLLLYWFLMAAGPSVAQWALGAHFLSIAIAMTGVGVSLPTYRRKRYVAPAALMIGIVVPVLVAAVATLVLAASPPAFGHDSLGPLNEDKWRMWPSALSAVAASIVGLAIAIAWSFRSRHVVGIRVLTDVPLWLLSGALASATYLGATAYLFGGDPAWISLPEGGVAGGEYLVIAGPALFIVAILIAGWTFSLFRGVFRRKLYLKSDLDREWLVRMSAVLIKPALAWTCLATISIVAVFFLFEVGEFDDGDQRSGLLGSLTALVSGGFASGLLGALSGKSGSTWIGYVRKILSLEILAIVGTVLFLIVTLMIGSLLSNQMAFAVHDQLNARCQWDICEPSWYMFLAFAIIMSGLGLMLGVFGTIVDVNRFSLNGFYRNRIARAFLGPARGGPKLRQDEHRDLRAPDPFTGFDPADNVRLHTLWPPTPPKTRRRALFPVINVTLNDVATTRLAWQERKALPFVLTPLACGSAMLDNPGTGDDPNPRGAYVAANYFGGREREQALEGYGITLAAAMAISGAAATPSMGYHSSPATAFLMTLFNVRLGAWLPNPALWRPSRQDDPVEKQRNSVSLLIRELMGRTDSQKPDVYLSDGGHFENLGLYEMIRRRCSSIVVVDAGCDPELQFEDLGNALRKISIDQNVDITFGDFGVEKLKELRLMKRAYAIGTIHYPENWQGKLLYIKPGMIKDPPLDVMAYASQHCQFPHEPTTDQWFSESQFESYRRLGHHLVNSLGSAKYSALSEGGARIRRFLDDIETASQALNGQARPAS